MSILKKILGLLTYSEKKNFYYLLILVLIMAFLDMLGIGFVFSFVSVVLDASHINKNEIINYIYNFSRNFGINSETQFVFFLGFSNYFFLKNLLKRGLICVDKKIQRNLNLKDKIFAKKLNMQYRQIIF